MLFILFLIAIISIVNAVNITSDNDYKGLEAGHDLSSTGGYIGFDIRYRLFHYCDIMTKLYSYIVQR